MCLLKLNHHDLTSKIHTVKSYKVTQAEDETDPSRLICTLCAYLAHAQSFFSSVALRSRLGLCFYGIPAHVPESKFIML